MRELLYKKKSSGLYDILINNSNHIHERMLKSHNWTNSTLESNLNKQYLNESTSDTKL